jgi:type III secretory pathway component EscR
MITALSVVMSLVVMQPVMSKTAAVLDDVNIAELSSQSFSVLLQRAGSVFAPWRDFLVEHSGDRELSVFSALAQNVSPRDAELVDRSKVEITTAIAAFVLSEIKKGFTLAFFLLIPFFVVDLIVANILVAMGLTMMSPVIVSLPIKLLLFVSSDGWLLLAQNLIKAYQ